MVEVAVPTWPMPRGGGGRACEHALCPHMHTWAQIQRAREKERERERDVYIGFSFVKIYICIERGRQRESERERERETGSLSPCVRIHARAQQSSPAPPPPRLRLCDRARAGLASDEIAGATVGRAAPQSHRSLATLNSTARGFEPLRAEPNGFRVHLLSRSDTLS